MRMPSIMKRTRRPRDWKATIIAAIVSVALVSGFLAFAVYKRSTRPPDPKPEAAPSLNGTWRQTNCQNAGACHVADIKNGRITIRWERTGDKATQLYWQGNLGESRKVDGIWCWNVKADQPALKKAMEDNTGNLVGRDKAKTLNWNKGSLSYIVDEFGGEAVVIMDRDGK
jgi:hypothetical protein